MKYIIISFIILFIFSSCKRAKILPVLPTSKHEKYTYIDNYIFNLNSNCTDTILDFGNQEPQFIFHNSYTNYAYFNPENPNEILYYKDNYSLNSNYKLLIYNRSTASSQLLFNSQLTSQAKWSRNGWVLLCADSIYKIKPNGDSLEALTRGKNAEWNFEGTKFVFKPFDESCTLLYNDSSKITDTLPIKVEGLLCWQNATNLMAFASTDISTNGLNIVDMNQMSSETVLDNLSPVGLYWLSEFEIIYGGDHNIRILNLKNNTITTIAKICPNEGIHSICYSSISNELLITVSHYKQIDKTKVEASSYLMILNFNDYSVTYIKPI
ncbi:MAG TPA: hypothetical protein PKC41_06480 [Chitinophagaceae bacterium]|jgi:hypothetical protein|nr:hypothetical protein [Chitinophagaceae bacterium]